MNNVWNICLWDLLHAASDPTLRWLRRWKASNESSRSMLNYSWTFWWRYQAVPEIEWHAVPSFVHPSSILSYPCVQWPQIDVKLPVGTFFLISVSFWEERNPMSCLRYDARTTVQTVRRDMAFFLCSQPDYDHGLTLSRGSAKEQASGVLLLAVLVNDVRRTHGASYLKKFST